ncbi:MAG TPA: ComEA family DNA-binding protein [Rhodothermales bacterium]|nr:ComEA family DNA-binding protein [Rhodothermales bacterium]
MKRLRRFAERLVFTRTEATALVVIASLYLVGFTWRYIQQTTTPFDPDVYAALDSLIAAGGLAPADTLPKPRKGGPSDSLGVDSLSAFTAGLLDINSATITQLIGLPGIGPALAARIIEHREKAGRFARPEDLIKVKGIGPAKLARIQPLITVRRQ